MIDRSEAVQLLHHYIHEKHLLHHAYSVEAIMISTAVHVQKDRTLWGLVGLLHDLDNEYTNDQPEKHGLETAQILQDLLPEEGLTAIKAHNYIHTSIVPTSMLDKALIASDALAGLIIAAAKITPQKTVQQVTLPDLQKKMKDTSFAGGCDREKIILCQDFGIEINDFLSLSLQAIQKIHTHLEL